MELAALRDQRGEVDRLKAILAFPSIRGSHWDLKELFESGRREVLWALKHVRSFGLTIDRSSALDFGCGVGRLTQALCDHFQRCVGIDVDPTIVEHARRLNRFGGRCSYLANDRSDLGVFPAASFSFIDSNIAPSREVIREFVRILKPGGIALFRVPAELLPHEQDTVAMPRHRPLSDADFRASIRSRRPLLRVHQGEKAVVEVKVKNTGASTWPAPAESGGSEVRLGNHWLDAEGAMLVPDDARAGLFKAVPPGGTVGLQLEVNAPRAAGNYRLELDLVREGIGWFSERGSGTVVLDVEVTEATRRGANGLIWKLSRGIHRASARLVGPKGRTPGRLDATSPTSSDHDFEAVDEKSGIPEAEVIALVEGAGGTIVGVTPNPRTGQHASSFDYCITKKA
jgi:SAM-dependent methyltransferase